MMQEQPEAVNSGDPNEPDAPEPDVDVDEDELFAELEKDDDHIMSTLRERRMDELKHEMKRAQDLSQSHHGTYENVLSEKEILKITTMTDRCIVHFYHKEFRRCQIMDKHLEVLARKHFTTRFVKIDVETCPFLVEKLKVQVLPCVICFIKGVSVDRVIGFEELGQSDAFQTNLLERRLSQCKVITLQESSAPKPRKTIFGFADKGSNGDDEDSD